MHAQPQYRVLVELPVRVSNVPDDIRLPTLSTALCFRESGSMIRDFSHCPLGLTKIKPNAGGPSQELDLILPTTLPPTYQGVGMYVVITGNSSLGTRQLGSLLFPTFDEAPGIITHADGSAMDAGNNVGFRMTFRVNCVDPALADSLDCVTPPLTTPPAITTTAEVTAETTTPASDTTDTANTVSPSEETTTSQSGGTTDGTTTGNDAAGGAQSVTPIAAGVGAGVAVILLIGIVLVVVLICVLKKRQRKTSDGWSAKFTGRH